MLSSLAAASSSSSMEEVKSTLTRWMGFIILPWLVKKREIDLPFSVMRAMTSAGISFFLERVFFIESLFFLGCSPQRYEMIELAFRILVNFKDYGIQAIANPADSAMFDGEIGTLVKVVGMKEDLPCFLEADSAPRIAAKARALPLIEVESHE